MLETFYTQTTNQPQIAVVESIKQQDTIKNVKKFIKINQPDIIAQNYPKYCQIQDPDNQRWGLYELMYSRGIGYYYKYQSTAAEGKQYPVPTCPEGVTRVN